jgi:NADPH2:quinone reductase
MARNASSRTLDTTPGGGHDGAVPDLPGPATAAQPHDRDQPHGTADGDRPGVPATMRAAVCRRNGTPDTVAVETVPVPAPGPGQVLIAVHAAAVNLPDVLLVAGRYQVPAPLPFTPGSEFAGEVAAAGPGVTRFAPGDRVSGLVMTGAFAQFAVAEADTLTPVAPAVALDVAAASWVCHLTAYHALRSVAGIAAGEHLVVLGAGGGVGLAAVELGNLLGARVIAAASSPEKLAACRVQGAEHLIDYTRENLRDAIRAVTGPQGAGVVIDPVGGPWSEAALRATGWGGRFVTVGFASGEIPKIPLNLVLLKGVVVKGFEIRTFGLHAPAQAARDRTELADLLASGRVSPHVGARFPLDDVAGALRHVAERRAVGKVVVQVRA